MSNTINGYFSKYNNGNVSFGIKTSDFPEEYKEFNDRITSEMQSYHDWSLDNVEHYEQILKDHSEHESDNEFDDELDGPDHDVD
jgi:hypothetical protein